MLIPSTNLKNRVRTSVTLAALLSIAPTIHAATVIESDLDITGNTHILANLDVDQNACVAYDLEVRGTAIVRGEALILQKEYGNCPPCIEFKDGNDIGGFIKAEIAPNMNPGQSGIAIRTDGIDRISVQPDCSIILNGKTIVNQETTINSDLDVHGDIHANGTITDYNCHKANLYLGNSVTYTLGECINFDMADDPGENVTDTPLTFVAPVSGVYLVSLQIAGDDLNLDYSVHGTPMAQIDIYQDDCIALSSFKPLLTFGDKVNHVLSGMIKMNAGQELNATISVLALTENGCEDIPGNLILTGTNSPSDHAICHMGVHYLSSCPDEI